MESGGRGMSVNDDRELDKLLENALKLENESALAKHKKTSEHQETVQEELVRLQAQLRAERQQAIKEEKEKKRKAEEAKRRQEQIRLRQEAIERAQREREERIKAQKEHAALEAELRREQMLEDIDTLDKDLKDAWKDTSAEKSRSYYNESTGRKGIYPMRESASIRLDDTSDVETMGDAIDDILLGIEAVDRKNQQGNQNGKKRKIEAVTTPDEKPRKKSARHGNGEKAKPKYDSKGEDDYEREIINEFDEVFDDVEPYNKSKKAAEKGNRNSKSSKNNNKSSHRSRRKRRKTKSNLIKVAGIVVLVGLIGVSSVYGHSLYIKYKANKDFEELQAQVNDVSNIGEDENILSDNYVYEEDTQSNNIESNGEKEEEKEDKSSKKDKEDKKLTYNEILKELDIEVPAKKLDWNELKSVNSDIYAWIYIPNTKIDYPILQSSKGEEYYLNRNMGGSEGKPGCIFTQDLNSKDFTDYNTVIYGHNMRSGEMFRTLHNFSDADFFKKNPYVYIYTKKGVLVYEIFEAYNGSDEHILKTNDFSTKEGYEAYLDKILNNNIGIHRKGIDVTSKNRIITLSTCTSVSDQRWLVQGILVNDPNVYKSKGSNKDD